MPRLLAVARISPDIGEFTQMTDRIHVSTAKSRLSNGVRSQYTCVCTLENVRIIVNGLGVESNLAMFVPDEDPSNG